MRGLRSAATPSTIKVISASSASVLGAGDSRGLLGVRMNVAPAVDGVVLGAYVETVTGEVSLWWDWGLR